MRLRCLLSSAPIAAELCALLSGGLLSAEPIALGLKTGAPQAADFLLAAAAANQGLYATIQSFVCQEQIERFQGHEGAPNPRHLDTVTAKVSFENGFEQYSDIRQKQRELDSMSALPGAWSQGEFGTLLKQTQPLLASQVAIFEYEEFTGSEFAAVFTFDTPTEQSLWDLTVEGRRHVLPFHTRVWISEQSKQILRIERTSIYVPGELGISSISWSVSLAPALLGGKSWLLPESAAYRVAYRNSDRIDWNTMKFSAYRRYSSETLLKFD